MSLAVKTYIDDLKIYLWKPLGRYTRRRPYRYGTHEHLNASVFNFGVKAFQVASTSVILLFIYYLFQ